MASPGLPGLKEYLGETSWSEEVLESVLATETASQLRRVKVTAVDGEPAYPADLLEALYRQCSVNLAMRSIPLGVQAQASEFGTTQFRVGGIDREVRRLEAPFRKLVVG